MLLKSKKKIGGITAHFSKLIHEQYLLKAPKYKGMYGLISQIEA